MITLEDNALRASRKGDREKIARGLIDTVRKYGPELDRRDYRTDIVLVFKLNDVGAQVIIEAKPSPDTSIISWFNAGLG